MPPKTSHEQRGRGHYEQQLPIEYPHLDLLYMALLCIPCSQPKSHAHEMVNNQEWMNQRQTRNIKLKYSELCVMVHNYEDLIKMWMGKLSNETNSFSQPLGKMVHASASLHVLLLMHGKLFSSHEDIVFLNPNVTTSMVIFSSNIS